MERKAAPPAEAPPPPPPPQQFAAHAARDPWLLHHKAAYALLCVAGAAVSPFLPLYLVSVGFTPRALGLLLAARPLVTLVAAPAWGAATDARPRLRRPVLVGTAGGGAAARWGMTAVPAPPASAAASAPTAALAAAGCALLAADALSAPTFALLDAATMALLAATSSTAHYGATRAAGPAAIAVFGLAAGWLLRVAGGLRGMFALHVGLTAVALVLLATLPLPSPSPAPAAAEAKPPQTDAGAAVDDAPPPIRTPSPWRALARRPDVAAFFGLMLLYGALNAVIGAYEFLYLSAPPLSAPPALLGAVLSLSCAAEVPLFLASSALLRRLGVPAVLLLAGAAYTARLAWYGLAVPALGSPWWALAAEPLHGVTFALAWAAAAKYAHALAPPGGEATAQALLGAVQGSAGTLVGCAGGGAVYASAGGPALFTAAAGAAALGTACLGASLLRRRAAAAEAVEGGEGRREGAAVGGKAGAIEPPAGADEWLLPPSVVTTTTTRRRSSARSAGAMARALDAVTDAVVLGEAARGAGGSHRSGSAYVYDPLDLPLGGGGGDGADADVSWWRRQEAGAPALLLLPPSPVATAPPSSPAAAAGGSSYRALGSASGVSGGVGGVGFQAVAVGTAAAAGATRSGTATAGAAGLRRRLSSV